MGFWKWYIKNICRCIKAAPQNARSLRKDFQKWVDEYKEGIFVVFGSIIIAVGIGMMCVVVLAFVTPDSIDSQYMGQIFFGGVGCIAGGITSIVYAFYEGD